MKEKERMIVDEEDVENALSHGCNPVMTFPSENILVEREAHNELQGRFEVCCRNRKCVFNRQVG